MQPTTARERIGEIDALRGVALFGIIAANMRGFNAPAEAYMQPHLLWPAGADRITQALIDGLITGKFITLFAVLFGLGFAVQLGRAENGNEGFAKIYLRRMAILALIGAAHAFLIWWGDILLMYALMGFALLLFRRASEATVALWAMILYWLPIAVLLGFFVMTAAGGQPVAPAPTPAPDALAETIRLYAQGSWRAMMAERYREWMYFNAAAPFFLSRILSLFLAGLLIWRSEFFHHLPVHRALLRRLMKWALPLGLACSAATAAVNEVWRPNPFEPSGLTLLIWTVGSVGVPALSFSYAALVILLFQQPRWRRRLLPFVAVGRMALTNYLLQSVLCTTLFYSFGFGLFGEVGPLAGLVPTIGIYSVQVVYSELWLRYFRFGPVEWLWRSVTYGSWQPLRTRPAESPAEEYGSASGQ
jgi:uncharacterized protein